MKPAKPTCVTVCCAATVVFSAGSLRPGVGRRRGAAAVGLGGLLLAGLRAATGAGDRSGQRDAVRPRLPQPRSDRTRQPRRTKPAAPDTCLTRSFYAEVERFTAAVRPTIRRASRASACGCNGPRTRSIAPTALSRSSADVDGLMKRQQERLSRGEPGMPIIPPAFRSAGCAAARGPEQTVRAGGFGDKRKLPVSDGCAALPRGYVRFTDRQPSRRFPRRRVRRDAGRSAPRREQGTATPIIDIGGQP